MARLAAARVPVPPPPPPHPQTPPPHTCPSYLVWQLVINITAAFGFFQRWTVGLGIEHQLQALQAAVGLPPTQVGQQLQGMF